MISFLIPTYNFDCTTLVLTLFRQSEALKKKLGDVFDFEILVADDASTEKQFSECYQWMEQKENCRFFPLNKNLGRAKIRNFLAEQAKYNYFVFIDCDAEVCTSDFVESYWLSREKGDVVCGALRNPDICPKGGALRYTYEKSAERYRDVDFRRSQPYTYFTTFNVLFHRTVFEHLKFDERCTEYGYEDALMGLMLEKHGFQVAHIDNPLIHNGIDPSAVYLKKVETSLRVLYKLGEPLQSASALVKLVRRLKSWGLLPLFSLFYRCFKTVIREILVGNRPSMHLLKMYKLGYYAELERADKRLVKLK